MHVFVVEINDRIGAMADILEVLAKANINVEGISVETNQNKAIIEIITDNDKLTKESLSAAGFEFHEHEAASITIRDRPGEIAKIARAIANLGINIQSAFIINKKDGRAEVLFRVNNLTEVKNLFK